jgi:outer membrane protein TolC
MRFNSGVKNTDRNRRELDRRNLCRYLSVTIAIVYQVPAVPILDREQFLKQLEARYPKLLGAAAERDGASAKRLSKQGAFDPAVIASIESQRFNSSSSRGKPQNGSGTVLEVEGATPQGMKYSFGRILNSGAVKSPNSSTGNTGTFFAEVKLPLLRGAGVNEKSVALGQARLDESAASLTLSALRQDVFLEGAQAYVKWAGTRRKADIARRLLGVAEFRLKGIKEEIRLQQRAPIEGTEAEAEVDLRRERLAGAIRSVEEAALKLSKYVWDDTRPLESEAEPIPRPVLLTQTEASAAEKSALEARPELRLLSLQREFVQLDANLAQNDRRWQVDLVVAPGRDLGTGGIGDTLKAGISASLPFNQRDARGRQDLARLKALKLAQETDLSMRQIEIEVRDAVSAVNRSYERFLAAESNVRRTREVEEGEITLFKNGVSSLFLVNQRERATAEAEGRLIDAQVDAEQARLALRAATMGF